MEKEILRPDAKLEAQKAALETAKQRGEQEDFTLQQKLGVIKQHGNDEMLNSMEDDLVKDDDDERVLQRFREARIREMKEKNKANKFGGCETLARDEFMVKVKQASKTEGVNGTPVYIVIELFKDGIPKSELTTRAVLQLCKQHLNVKFVRMVADQCIPNWPDSNVPSIFVYYDGEAIKQLIGFEQCASGDAVALERVLCAMMQTKPKLTALVMMDDEEDEFGVQQQHHTYRSGGISKSKLRSGDDEDDF